MDSQALAIVFLLGFAPCCRSAETDGADCEGRRVYMYDLPPQFNARILAQCEFGLARWLNFCPHAANDGLGEPYPESSHVTLGDGWFDTNSYMLEVIYHARMRRYRCLTRDPARADAFFVPYYAGLDALRYLYGGARSLPHGHMLMSWLREKAGPQWERSAGRDHFLVMGRTAWDFDRNGAGDGGWNWGTGMLNLPGVANMTALLIERRPWKFNEQGVPYPTSFHPTVPQLVRWLARVGGSRRTALFAFAGSARRPQAAGNNFRSTLFRLCAGSNRCELVDCGKSRCSHDSEPIISAFLRSTFCLQPKGDTPTRRSTFDSIVAGCVPVFFDRDSAYTQYTWHLPPDPRSYSVFISEETVARDPGSIQRVLESIPPRRLREMQRNVAGSIPGVLYMMPNSSDSSPFPRDAFDIAVRRVVDRIAGSKRRDSATASGLYRDN